MKTMEDKGFVYLCKMVPHSPLQLYARAINDAIINGADINTVTPPRQLTVGKSGKSAMERIKSDLRKIYHMGEHTQWKSNIVAPTTESNSTNSLTRYCKLVRV